MMAWGPGNIGGGGAGGIELTIVASETRPERPKMNTLWVKTAPRKIDVWAFDSQPPAKPVEGMLWIETNAVSKAAIDLAKRDNRLVVRVAGYHIMQSGSWVKVGGELFDGFNWHSFRIVIVENGTMLVNISPVSGRICNLNSTTGQITTEPGYLVLKARGAPASASSGSVFQSGVIDVSGKSTLTLTGQLTNNHRATRVAILDDSATIIAESGFEGGSPVVLQIPKNAGNVTVCIAIQGAATQKVSELVIE